MRGMDPNQLFAQAKKMKDDAAKAEKALDERMVEGKAGDGAVSVVSNGNGHLEAVRIKPEAVDMDDLEMLEDLVLVAVRDAMSKASELRESEMSKVTGGLDLGGLL